MSDTVGDFILDRLAGWGVRRVYGYPGDGINGVIAAFARGEGRPELIQVRHEEMAALAATGHAKFTGEPGVCMATSGPGAIHLLNGLYDAKLDHQPVVAIVGQQARLALGGNYQQEVDLVSLMKDVAGEYVQMATEPAQVRHLIDRALRIALAGRTVTCVIVPHDLQQLPAEPVPPHEHGTVHSAIGYRSPRVIPAGDELERAAAVLNAGERVAILVGQGAMGAGSEVERIADLLGAGVAKALLGKAALPDDLPWVTGSIGLLGTKPSWDIMMNADTLLMIGRAFPTRSSCPRRARCAACRSISTGACSASAIRSRSASWATRARRCARSRRCSRARTTAHGASRSSARSPNGGAWRRSARTCRPIRSTRSSSSGSSPSDCPTTPS
jgi:pyruvate dehydrogenase (quinone)